MAKDTYVKRSRIHGRGLFARRRLTRGRFIGSYEGRPTRRNGRYVLWIPGNNGALEGIHGTGPLRYVNHSPRPNATFYGPHLFSLRRIAPHEEITIDYGDEWDDVA